MQVAGRVEPAKFAEAFGDKVSIRTVPAALASRRVLIPLPGLVWALYWVLCEWEGVPSGSRPRGCLTILCLAWRSG